MNKYLLVVWKHREPEVIGPFDDENERIDVAKVLRRSPIRRVIVLLRLNAEATPEVSTLLDLD